MNKISTFSVNDIQLMLNTDERKILEALAAVSLNPNVTWIKFTLLDDKPNLNRQRVPKEEFANVLKTGLYMPIKMALGEISEGHQETFPLGVITHLLERDDKIEALAALWLRERGEDVELLKEKFAEEKDINFSWEITFSEEKQQEGFVDLLGVSVNAATIVGMPAYLGRTSVQALASIKETIQASLEDEDIMDTISTVEHERGLLELRQELNTAHEAKLNEVKAKYDELKTEHGTLSSELQTLKAEATQLREFKSEIDTEKERVRKLAEIKEKFATAKIEVEDGYFEAKAEILLAMSDAQLDFFLQELSAFKPEAVASVRLGTTNAPAIRGKSEEEVGKKEVLEFLTNLDKK